MVELQCKHWSDAAFSSIWWGSTLFAQPVFLNTLDKKGTSRTRFCPEISLAFWFLKYLVCLGTVDRLPLGRAMSVSATCFCSKQQPCCDSFISHYKFFNIQKQTLPTQLIIRNRFHLQCQIISYLFWYKPIYVNWTLLLQLYGPVCLQQQGVWLLFSSPEPKGQGELLWPSSVVRCASSVVCLSTFYLKGISS